VRLSRKASTSAALLLGELEAADEAAFKWVVAADARVGAVGDRAAAGGVVVEDLVQGGDAAVVHVGGGDGDVAEGGDAEAAHVGGDAGELVEAGVAGRVGALAVEVVEAGVVVDAAAGGLAGVGDAVLEVEAGVAMEALELLAPKSAAPRRADSEIAAVSPAR
jgi:hypothetical protein